MIKKRTFVYFFLLSIISINTFAASNPKSTGDLVARDLQIWGVGWAGHVGIWTGNEVLEVLNDRKVIHKNSLSSFKRSSPYWGARYGKGASQAYKVISWGYKQRYYNPKYTTTAKYRVGGWVKKWVWDSRKKGWVKRSVMQNAKYRCDTFVYSSFKNGNGTQLAGWTITPRTVFYNMPYSR